MRTLAFVLPRAVAACEVLVSRPPPVTAAAAQPTHPERKPRRFIIAKDGLVQYWQFMIPLLT